MDTLIFVLHVFSCLFLVGLILIQKGHGASMGAAFGGASQTVFGSRGPATFLNKLTIVIAVIFLGASIYLAHAAKYKVTATVVDEAKRIETETSRAEEVIKEDEAATVPAKEVVPENKK